MAQLKIGTRGSELARWQANTVATLLRERAGVECEIVIIKTTGDRLSEAKLSQIGGKRLFVKEIEDALLAGDVDLAVHSSKDMPAVLPDGLTVGAVLPREDARDALVLPQGKTPELGSSSRIGTSSIRRTAQLRQLFAGARFEPVRGNLDTRLRKLDSGEYDALVLAAAGLRRLGREDRIAAAVPVDVCVPAPGQGIIAVEIREGDDRVRRAVQSIDDADAAVALCAERTVVTRLGGGCQMPIGVLAEPSGTELTVTGIVVSPDGARIARASATGVRHDAERLGISVADELLRGGAG